MKGRHHFEIRNSRCVFKFDLEHNITVIKGDSATGKSTLVGMISDYERLGASSGIALKCDKKCIVIGGQNWELILKNTSDCIVFIDEGSEFVRSRDFAECVKGSDNYFVIITRENLFNLPISVEAIYGIRGRKYFKLKRTYNSLYRIYESRNSDGDLIEKVITEDSQSGYQFFSAVFEDKGIECVSSNGNSNILNNIKDTPDKITMVIADGAAFGAYMEMMSEYIRKYKGKLSIYLPESFEWLILSSGLVKDKEIDRSLESPYEYIDSREYFSREQYYTALLIEKTKDSYMKYNKAELNKSYLNAKEKAAVIKTLPEQIKKELL